MKQSIIALLSLIAFVSHAAPAVLPPPSNPVPQIAVAWNLPPVGTLPLTNVYVWVGTASRQYTSKTLVGNVTNTTVFLPQRGVAHFLTTTLVYQGNIESPYSNEISYTPFDPLPATMSPPLVLVVQSKPVSHPNVDWETFLTYSIDPATVGQAFQLKLLAGNFPPPTILTPQAKAVAAMRATIARPMLPQ
jgi:hypothetical protein